MKSDNRAKLFLYLTEFFSGMAVMAVELSASRLLAPYFSSSQIVWTIIIGTIMIAMALGNIFGGRWADRDSDPAKLYFRLMISAVWIAAIPVLGRHIILGISAAVILTVNTNFLIWAAFASCMIVFVFPLFLLGTVTPSLVKYTVESLDEGGSVVGRLGACNTVGSILGTFLPTFVSIPAAGTACTFLIFSGILLLLAVVYFAVRRERLIRTAAAVVLFVIFCILGSTASFAFWEKGLTYEGESVYNYLQVREDEEQVILSTNVLFGVQSVYNKQGGLTGMYYDYAMAAPVFAGRAEGVFDVLVLGNGTGTFVTQCRRYFGEKNVRVDAVEIDEKITRLARGYFSLDDEVAVDTYDGRAYLNVNRKKYDVILVDAYQDITIPFSMSSREFFSEVRDHLKPDGVMVVNLNMRSEGGTEASGKPGIAACLCDTISSCFERVWTVDVPYSTNREVFAVSKSYRKADLTEEDSSRKTGQAQLDLLVEKVQAGMKAYEGEGHILTDDKAPVELLGMRTIDGLIRGEIKYYKKIFHEQGLKGLLEAMS